MTTKHSFLKEYKPNMYFLGISLVLFVILSYRLRASKLDTFLLLIMYLCSLWSCSFAKRKEKGEGERK
jgi:cell division protein FtsW (lipid II flippase)